MTWPALLMWLLLLGSIFAPIQVILYLFFASFAFGGLSMLPPEIIGNIPVSTVCAAVLFGKTFGTPARVHILLEYALNLKKLGLLGLFSVYAAGTAFLYPRLLKGTVQVYLLNFAGNLSPLQPTSANVNQTGYMLTSMGIAFVFAYAGQSERFQRHFLTASLFGSLVLLGTGLTDYALGSVGREDLLDPFHNATYHLLDSVAIAGQKRVVGFMPEASVFGAVCCSQLSFLVFNRGVYEGMWRKWVVPLTAAGLLVMVYLSTSSGTYVGAIVLVALMVGKFGAEALLSDRLKASHLRQAAWGITAVVAGAFIFTLLSKGFVHHLQVLADETLLDKTATSSYIERSSWTRVGWAAFLHTDGIGCGVGSVRTSNWPVNFAASTGVIGIVLFGLFVLKTILPTTPFPNPRSKRLATGLLLAAIPALVMTSLAGTTPDPGPSLMLTLGLVYALRQTGSSPSPRPRFLPQTAGQLPAPS